MTTYGYILPGASKIARLATSLSSKAKHRIKVIDWYRAHGKNKSLTARYFGMNRETLDIWLDRFKLQGIKGLEDRSHRPKHLRTTSTPLPVQDEVVKLRKAFPYYSKYKIVHLLSTKISSSTVGRILKKKDLINPKVSRKKIKAAKHPKKRFPRELVVNMPGKLIQIDTKHLRTFQGVKIYQFTAIDVLTKVRVLWVSTHLSSVMAAKFLRHCVRSFPFKIENIQTDNGSEFNKHFDRLCQKLGNTHYYIEAHSPQQNSYVERSHLTDELEFYQQGNMHNTLGQLLPRLKAWEHQYNHQRPHQSLNYLTPIQYLKKYQTETLATKDYVALQTN
ncbi:MAG: hypothetical protein A3I07_04500 [Candidatus Doudnabacteria bacterium RIFCSPLOWO2_02_FULL_42_9]|uniref:Integrase catalytic domain-containing protein n=1 Tax=Candidatus Doudnabacteria bacterium RIFCSPHIGHO2_01_FULL_41_86 TaxID=1817821 RepID=A0A1F5N9F6_9BACT|nr:MAG: hypothetical protein A2717_01990 [Candidatus Doudnabacteria bacterium RIFCSPHIGHO2_01_FULL_41_86]OGE75079.1 MAG: hypothetical protein A3K07_03820 [Candidatus Doudnabacteria bacterium RIFCSPHIGHO2_01_43_10]OGE85335.1 MAG: hypothetical protein A3E28_01560 [Candidatus Doudnabacteria bacterium RIFCSPHIGHO2_12_FULL_42_22]OGE86873.1 MAG: hypothetical protein A3C49_02395 [Candidatus Doudnabacteria bacterium RIFCSPHIGHO2_02_FULL_42_25]OGE92472.1 MAG: hypothetical protein A2895_02550 [Candidatus